MVRCPPAKHATDETTAKNECCNMNHPKLSLNPIHAVQGSNSKIQRQQAWMSYRFGPDTHNVFVATLQDTYFGLSHTYVVARGSGNATNSNSFFEGMFEQHGLFLPIRKIFRKKNQHETHRPPALCSVLSVATFG